MGSWLFIILKLLSILIFLLTAFITVTADVVRPQLFSFELKNADSQEYKTLEMINRHPSVTKGPYKIWINYSPISYFMTGGRAFVSPKHPDKIFLNRLSKNEPYVDMVIAHEVGHLESSLDSEFIADKFAAKIVGTKRVLDGLKWMSDNYGEYEEGNQRIRRMEILNKNSFK